MVNIVFEVGSVHNTDHHVYVCDCHVVVLVVQ
jgi:hypothetical protein